MTVCNQSFHSSVLFEVASYARPERSQAFSSLVASTARTRALAQFDRTVLGEKVTAVWTDPAALHVVSGPSNSRAPIPYPVGSSERQNRHCQSLSCSRLRQAFVIEVCPVPIKTGAHSSRRGILTRIFVDRGRIYRVGSCALGRKNPGKAASRKRGQISLWFAGVPLDPLERREIGFPIPPDPRLSSSYRPDASRGSARRTPEAPR